MVLTCLAIHTQDRSPRSFTARQDLACEIGQTILIDITEIMDLEGSILARNPRQGDLHILGTPKIHRGLPPRLAAKEGGKCR
ncbi:hypothetical protein [Paracoccus litorisediminis]|uniref:hypothetical protein n=1 Tax=Paracoccus litorisediminis TaxID=2006130 RepID=UPI003735AF17